MITVRRLIWDNWNVAHIARHDVTPEEVEDVCHGSFIVRASYQRRLVLIGPTRTRRMLAVILQPLAKEDEYYPVTACPASRKERQLYRAQQGGGTP